MNAAQQQGLADDLAYVRTLAEEGAHAPLVSGRYFLIWGTVMAAASGFVYLGVLGLVPFSGVGYMMPWVIAGILGWVLTFTIGSRSWAKPGAATLGNKTASAVWFAVGVMMTLFFVAINFTHARYVSDGVPAYFMFTLLFPISFGMYGIAFYATAVAARTPWLKGFVILALAIAMLSFFLLTSPHQFLVGAIGIVVCAVVPGLILIAREPAELV